MIKFAKLSALFCLLAFASITLCLAQTPANQAVVSCGEVVTINTHAGSTTHYAYRKGSLEDTPSTPITLLLLVGGSGYVDLDEQACPRALKGNSLIRMIPLFSALGFTTALVDAPTDYHGIDGLGGFRIKPEHAQDIGKIVADLRVRTQGAIWLIGTSRGTISAANAASRLTGAVAPDGIVLTSALTSGQNNARIPWAAHSVFDLPLNEIHIPLLVIGHEKDNCPRSPASLMNNILTQSKSIRQQMITITAGPGDKGAACEGYSAHGFLEQEREVVTDIAKFIYGETEQSKK